MIKMDNETDKIKGIAKRLKKETSIKKRTEK